MDIDQDPFLIDSWEEYAKECIKQGQVWRFRKALCDYIFITNKPIREDIRAYGIKRMGDWAKEDLEEVIRRKKRDCI